MATSGSIDFNQTRNEIILDALSSISAVGIGESVKETDVELCSRALNRLIKSWQTNGIHLWLKKEATLFLSNNTNKYLLGGAQSDHVTETYYETTLTADLMAPSSSYTVASTSNMTVGDFLGIVLDNGTLSWDTIATIPNSTTVTSTNPTTSDASSGNIVFFYTTKITRPLFIFSGRREDDSDIEIPMFEMSHEVYYDLPNKTTTGVPVNYNYDPQLGNGILRVWPTPDDVTDRINLTYAREVFDFDSSTDDPDFPSEWLDAITLNLAVRLGPHFGKAGGENFNELKMQAKEALAIVAGNDSEIGALSIQPDFRGRSD